MKIINKYIAYPIFILLLSLPVFSEAQLNSVLSTPTPQTSPTNGNPIGQGGGPFDNTPSSNNNANGTMNANASGPGGPVDPPPDVVPIDNWLLVLIMAGLIHGYYQFKQKKPLPKTVSLS